MHATGSAVIGGFHMGNNFEVYVGAHCMWELIVSRSIFIYIAEALDISLKKCILMHACPVGCSHRALSESGRFLPPKIWLKLQNF
jgi:hypothetical protein